MATRLEMPKPKKEEPKEPQIRAADDNAGKAVGEAQAQKAELERGIRRFVKRTGGFRFNLHRDDKKTGRELIRNWNDLYKPIPPRTEKDGWDTGIHVKGYDNVDHFINQRHVKPRK